MARLIDASVLISLERRDLSPETVAGIASGEPLAIASITASELLVGVHLANTARRRSLREAFIEAILAMVPIVPFDLNVARTHATVVAQLHQAGLSVGPNDLIVAATALAHGAGVLTENVREFERVPGLAVASPGW